MKAEVSTHAICDENGDFYGQLERGVHAAADCWVAQRNFW